MIFLRAIFWGLFASGLFTIVAPTWMILYIFMVLGFFGFALVCAVPILFFLDWVEVQAMLRGWTDD